MSTTAEATEGQVKIRQLLTDLRYGHFDSDAIGAINSMLDQALAILDASPPIVGELTEEEIKSFGIAEHESEFAQHFADGLRYARDHGYLAQAPQSSPAPSVIEAGDAMENMMRRLRTQRDDEGILPTGNDFNGMDGLCAAWVAAKASRPSVTAPQGVTEDQIKGVISEVDDMHPYKVAGNADSYSSYNEGWSDACGIIEGRLSALLTNPK